MKSSLKRVITALLAAVLLAAAPCTSAFGAQTYYVNDGDNTLALADAYAIGADGSTAKLPERGVYAATASGTQLLGGSEYENEQPNIPNGIVRVGLAFGSPASAAKRIRRPCAITCRPRTSSSTSRKNRAAYTNKSS